VEEHRAEHRDPEGPAELLDRGERAGGRAGLLVVDAGLAAAAVDDVLSSDRYAAEVAPDVRQARAYGATGVPFFVVDGRYGISGAQPTELFAQALAQAWSESVSA
jgi:predicted DsbA family dithiol-disulfide isomerase